MTSRHDIDDELWAAIGDPTRRRMLDLLLTGGPGTASGLSRQLPVTRQAVAKHLTVLERAGLIRGTWAEASGRRRRVYELTPAGRRTLADERGSWRQFAAAVTALLEPAPNPAAP